jgi:uncharacterized membrane protein YoaK (UPF0700 family)
MNIGGHNLQEHLRLLAPLFGLIAAVWALRMVVHASNAPHEIVHLLSVTLACAVSVLLATLLIHLRRFGGYANVIVSVVFLEVWTQLLIVAAIAFTALTGIHTVFADPVYSPGRMADPRIHIAAQLTFVLGFGIIFGIGMGCLLLVLLRLLVPLETKK